MAKDEMIDERVSVTQCKNAVDALYAHVSKTVEKKADTQLLPDAEPVFWLTIALKKQPEGKGLKVLRIPVEYPIVDPRKESVCLFTKDPQRTYKDLIADNNIHFVHRVIGLEKLKGKHKSFEARRALLKEHGLFLADSRIIPLLPKLLGSKFFDAKKQPIPVELSRKDLKGELERAVSSTYMPSIRGTSLSIKIGRLSQKPEHVVANLKKALPAVAVRVNGGWDNIQSLGIKTSSSVNLPIWSCSLDAKEGGRWAGFDAPISEDVDEDVDMDDVNNDPSAGTESKGKKRAADTDDEDTGRVEIEKPKNKKSKGVDGAKASLLSTAAIDAPPKSKKSKASVLPTSIKDPSSTDDAALSTLPALPQSISKSKTKKAPGTAAPAPTPANTPATVKKTAVSSAATAIVPETPAPAPKKKEKNGAAKITPEVVEPAPTTPDTGKQTAPKKKEKGSKKTTVANADIDTAASAIVADTESEGKGLKKGKGKKAAKSVELEVEAKAAEVEKEDNTAEASKSSKKKGKKEKSTSDVTVEKAPAVTESTEGLKKKAKGRKSGEMEEPGAATIVTSTVDSTPATPDARKKKDKKAKGLDSEKKVTASEQGSIITTDDLKQKKTDAPGEKKKGKVVKAKGGKSAKDALLGKKVL
ncbi:ribosomal protein L1p/L10e family-domain-containing protein [Rhodocollybia butyracea]|uniref:Ribosomal L1 domain-containing protein 1 n=1 Tax=Rhodocollybia butyracea TaxID=206335 RepID=A0A9P5PH57_9AGAR|nr:ribosomal protein L1p/L10e family-domain-containing protein [Rhodocollybia butyracea]